MLAQLIVKEEGGEEKEIKNDTLFDLFSINIRFILNKL